MADPTEELEPLFDYSRVQPVSFINLDDSDSDSDSQRSTTPKRRKKNKEEVSNKNAKGKRVEVVECDDDDDEEEEKEKENWLPPPPKNVAPPKLFEDSTIKELRLKKLELASLVQSTKNAILAADEAANKVFTTSSQSFAEETPEEVIKPTDERTKIVITIQDKAGAKQYRIFAGDKFEQLFKNYAQKAKINVNNLVFTFDGDKINPELTPQSLGMEDDDQIEVHVKSS